MSAIPHRSSVRLWWSCSLLALCLGPLLAEDELGPANQEFSLPDADTSPTPEAEAGSTRRGAKGKSDWIAAPVPFSNPTIGTGLGAMVGYFFPITAKDQLSPPSAVMLGGFGSSSDSWGVFAGHRGYYDNDRWRWTAGGGYMDFHYTYYGNTYEQNQTGLSVDIEQQLTLGFVEVMTQVWKDCYLGPRLVVVDSVTTLDDPRIPPALAFLPAELDLKLHSRVVTPGIHGQYDTRDNTFTPTQGWLVDGAWSLSPEEFGSTKTYTQRNLAVNRYCPLATAQVLALRASGRYASDGAPFYALPSVGMGGDFRGYVGGRYRDQCLMTTQGEYRWMFTDRFGMAGFAGVAVVGSNPANAWSNTWLPSYGGGLRARLSKEFPISFRFDAAWGRDEHAVYFAVGEAF